MSVMLVLLTDLQWRSQSIYLLQVPGALRSSCSWLVSELKRKHKEIKCCTVDDERVTIWHETAIYKASLSVV